MQIINNCLIVSLQRELSKPDALHLQREILEKIHGEIILGVILDFSGIHIVDSVLCQIFSETARMISLMGKKMIISSLNPGTTAAIIDLGIDIDHIQTVKMVEEGIRKIISAEGQEKEMKKPIIPIFSESNNETKY